MSATREASSLASAALAMTGTSPGAAPLLSIRDLTKRFGGLTALDGVDLEIRPGQVHALLGENGSGKSTLIKILSGTYAPEPGATIQVRGRSVPVPVPPGYFRRLGISFVHQDLALVPELSVTENLRLATVVAGRGPFIRWGRERRAAASVFEEYGIAIDPAATVDSLTDAQKALVAILRAVAELGESRALLVLDEPTVFLSKEDADLLFRVVKDLVRDGGMSALLVSHDMSEVLEHADRVTVLRAGRVQAHLDTEGTTADELVSLIVGRSLSADAPRDTRARLGDPVVSVRDLCARAVDGLSFDVADGEIVGVTGLAGSGVEDVLPGLYGAVAARGTLTVHGDVTALATASPRSSIAGRIVYVPADRKVSGGVATLSVEQNVTLPVLQALRGMLGISPARERERATRLAADYDVRPADPAALFGTLSGGNQQKAVLAKWMQDSPRLVLLQEPTQGIDVGARAGIFAMLRRTAAQGVSIVCASTDYDQLASVCDRVIVLAHGRVHDVLEGDRIDRDVIASTVVSSLVAPAPGSPTHRPSATAEEID
ncbi:sugar ABC transporter ATP-binding protein [Herbiconiux liukaitaii]|uniref:sugar ABC transporter ATP-binding protein n=1 Tax=Herbiconiux liukaitaii TaxID=3342799 RepID=UPI0035B924E4